MGISVKDIVNGRKTFFITPDTSLIPEGYLEDFFALGYECYFIEYDIRIPIEKKIEIILSLFDDVILFFNVDFNIPDFSWATLIKKIQKKYEKVKIGVMYAKRQIKDDKAKLEQKYLYDMEINCGCIQLEYQKRNNFELIEKILYANQAQGKRRNIRAICSSACTFSCMYKLEPFNGKLQDISLSHFTVLLPKENCQIALYEKVADFRICLRGVMFYSDAVLIMKREVGDSYICVFAFVSKDGAQGLDQITKQLLIENIYKIMNLNCLNLINQTYSKSDLDGSVANLSEIEDINHL